MVWSFRWALGWEEILQENYRAMWLSSVMDDDASGSTSPFFHPDVVMAWVESMGGVDRVQPFFLQASSDSGGRAFLPLARLKTGWKQGWVRRLRPAGDRLFDYHDPSLSGTGQDGFWTELLDNIHQFEGNWYDELDLPRVRGAHLRDDTNWRLSDKSPFVRLDAYADFDAFLRSRPKSLRGDARRQIRRLSETGEVAYRVHDRDGLSDVLNWIPDLERERESKYPGARLPAGYLARLADSMSPNGPVHCSSITLDGKSISWHIGFRWRGVMYWYVPIYDAAFSAWSPGKIHLYFAIEDAFRTGVHTFDFLRGQETYKAGWTDSEEFRMYGTGLHAATPASLARRGAAFALNKVGYARALLAAGK